MGNDKDKLNLGGVFPLDKADQMQPKAPRRPKDPMASHLPKFPFGEAGKSASPKGPVKGKGPVKVTGPLKGHGPLKGNGPVKVAGPANGNGSVKVPTSTHPEANAKGYVPSQGDGTTLASDPLKGTVNPQNGTTQMNDPAQTTPPATQNGGTTTAQLDPSKSASISERVDRPRHSPRSHHSPQEGNSPRPHHSRGRGHHPRHNPAADAPSEGGENRTETVNKNNASAAAGTGAAGTVVVANGGRHATTHGGAVQSDNTIKNPTNDLNQDQGNEAGQNKPDELTNKPAEATDQNPATELPQDQGNGAGQETPPATAQDQAAGSSNGGNSAQNNAPATNASGSNQPPVNSGHSKGGEEAANVAPTTGHSKGGEQAANVARTTGHSKGGEEAANLPKTTGQSKGGAAAVVIGTHDITGKLKRVDTEVAIAWSKRLDAINEMIRQYYLASVDRVNKLSSSWTSEAATTSISNYKGVANKRSDYLYDVIRQYREYLLKDVAYGYADTEEKVTKKSDLI